MSNTILIGANNRANFDLAFAQTGLATYETPTELETRDIEVPVSLTLNGKELQSSRSFSFTAAQIKALTLPHTLTRSIPVVSTDLNLNTSIDMDFVVTERETITGSGHSDRSEFIRFVANGQSYRVGDDTGKIMSLSEGLTLWDYGREDGVLLYNKKAVYSGETLVTPASMVPGYKALLSWRGDDALADMTSFTDTYSANGAGHTVSTKTYTESDTDWGTDYTLEYTEVLFTDGAKFRWFDASTVPVELINNSGSNDLRSILPPTVEEGLV